MKNKELFDACSSREYLDDMISSEYCPHSRRKRGENAEFEIWMY
jgi:hypothetical protein